MRKVWTPPWRWVFGVATVLRPLLVSMQAYRLTLINTKPGMSIESGKLLILNLSLWYLPALLMPAIVWAARRVSARGRAHASAPSPCPRAGALTLLARRTSSVCSPCGSCSARHGGKPPTVPWRSTSRTESSSSSTASLMVYAVDRRRQPRDGLLPRVAGAEAQGRAARDAPGRSAAQDARGRAASALSLQHAARDLDAGAPRSRIGRSDDQPAERPAAHHLRSERRAEGVAEGRDGFPAEVPRHRTDALPGSSHGAA